MWVVLSTHRFIRKQLKAIQCIWNALIVTYVIKLTFSSSAYVYNYHSLIVRVTYYPYWHLSSVIYTICHHFHPCTAFHIFLYQISWKFSTRASFIFRGSTHCSSLSPKTAREDGTLNSQRRNSGYTDSDGQPRKDWISRSEHFEQNRLVQDTTFW